jgi:hypothetical protein
MIGLSSSAAAFVWVGSVMMMVVFEKACGFDKRIRQTGLAGRFARLRR